MISYMDDMIDGLSTIRSTLKVSVSPVSKRDGDEDECEASDDNEQIEAG